MTSKHKEQYVNKRLAMKSFNGLMGCADTVIKARYDPGFALRVHDKAKAGFDGLIPDIPYIGGRKNPFSEMLVKAAAILALYRGLQDEGVSQEEFGEILEELTRTYMNTFPGWVRTLAGKLWMSGLFYRMMNRSSRISQQREYEDDFVYEVVPGDGYYRWGINYLECGISKFFNNQGEGELAKYACILDYHMFPAIGVHLERTGTIAQGCAQCDFRFS